MSPQAWRASRNDRLPWRSPEAANSGGWPVTVRHVPAIEVAGFAHRGSYMRIGCAFETAHIQFAAQGLMRPDTRWLAQYQDNPFAFPEAQLNPREVAPADLLTDICLPLEAMGGEAG